jgi:DNA polymerase IIIc chi subunit
MAVLNYQMVTERLHRTVFYYKNNEYLIKYTGTISILLKGMVALVHSVLVSQALFSLKLWHELPHHLTFTPESFLVHQSASHTTNNRGSVLLTCRGKGETTQKFFSL